MALMLVLAHRGASGYAPENTWSAFLLACEMGASGIETDVQVSKDGVLVLFHDTKVDRTTDGRGTVGELTWAELSRLDAGSWLDARFGGERIVRLDAFLDWRFPRHRLASLAHPPGIVYGPGDVIGPGAARTSGAWPGWRGGGTQSGGTQSGGTQPGGMQPGQAMAPELASAPGDDLMICLEVKAPAAVDRLVMMLAARALTTEPAIQLTSFHWESVVRVHRALPRLVAGFLTPRFDRAEIERVRAAGLSQICPRADLLAPELVEAAHQCGLTVRAWGVTTREQFAEVVASGADGTTLNWPDWAR